MIDGFTPIPARPRMHENLTPMPHEQHRADPRSPFVFDARELGRRPGSMREYRRQVPAPAGLGSGSHRGPGRCPARDRRPAGVGYRRRARHGHGHRAAAPASAGGASNRSPTSWCVDVCELFAYPDSVTDETTEEDEIYRVESDLIDFEPVVRDAVVLGLPWTPLCRPDCAGLCPTCGQRLDDLPAGHTHEQLDPRWAALARFAEPGASDGEAQHRTTKE